MEFLSSSLIGENELQKVVKKNEASLRFSRVENTYKALDLAFGELVNNVNLINEELGVFDSISNHDIMNECSKLFQKNNCTSLYYGKM